MDKKMLKAIGGSVLFFTANIFAFAIAVEGNDNILSGYFFVETIAIAIGLNLFLRKATEEYGFGEQDFYNAVILNSIGMLLGIILMIAITGIVNTGILGILNVIATTFLMDFLQKNVVPPFKRKERR